MGDLLFVGLALLFFACSWGVVELLARLMGGKL